MNASTPQMPRPRQRGFSLTEVLISLLVLSIGISCTIATQLAAWRTSRHAFARASALQIAAVVADRLRNLPATADDSRLTAGYFAIDYLSQKRPAGDDSPDCFNEACDTATTRRFIIRDWENWIDSDLPGGRLKICRDTVAPDSSRPPQWECLDDGRRALIVVKIGWPERDASAAKSGGLPMGGNDAPGIVLAVGEAGA